MRGWPLCLSRTQHTNYQNLTNTKKTTATIFNLFATMLNPLETMLNVIGTMLNTSETHSPYLWIVIHSKIINPKNQNQQS